ncbi:MAG: hypothetical protein WCB85_00090, partial [Candidatus Dormiibacterota bacterium]
MTDQDDQAQASSEPPAPPSVTLSDPTLHHVTMADGTTGLNVQFSVTNAGSGPIEADRLSIGVVATPAGGTAEREASVYANLSSALAPGENRQEGAGIQLDAGTWAVHVYAEDASTGASLARSPEVTAEIAGKVTAEHSFDESQTFSLAVEITHVEHLGGGAFRVHYTLTNNSSQELPSGLRVAGSFSTSGARGDSYQNYELSTPLPAGQTHQHYLTLEADAPAQAEAMIVVDPAGPSYTQDSVDVDIAADGTPTMSRGTARGQSSGAQAAPPPSSGSATSAAGPAPAGAAAATAV